MTRVKTDTILSIRQRVVPVALLLICISTVSGWRRNARVWSLTGHWALLVITMLAWPRATYVNQRALLLPLCYVFRQMARPGIIVAIGLVLLVGPWALDVLLAPPLNSPEHMLWQQRVINPILPVGLAIALLAVSPRAAKGDPR